MKPLTQIQEQWLQALESGKYKKGTTTLKRIALNNQPLEQPEYCCLGVACEILKETLSISEVEHSSRRAGEKVTSFSGFISYPPPHVTQALGLHDETGVFKTSHGFNPLRRDATPGIYEHLGVLNDSGYEKDTDFKRIAKFIRENAQFIFKQNETKIDSPAAKVD